MNKEKAAVRVQFEDRLNDLNHELEGDLAFLAVRTEEGGLSSCLAGGLIEKADAIALIAYGAANVVKRLGETEEQAEQFGIHFIRAFGFAMKRESPEPEINIWRDDDEDDDE